MTALFAPSVGSLFEPTVSPSSAPEPAGRGSLFEIFVRLPQTRPPASPRTQLLTARLRTLTGWSVRATAQALGTTHPTISALLAGRQAWTPRIPELPGRLAALVELAERINRLVGGEAASVDTALKGVPPGQTLSALDHLREGDLGRAYTTALDVLQPPRRTGMMRGVWPTTPGEATVALDDERA